MEVWPALQKMGGRTFEVDNDSTPSRHVFGPLVIFGQMVVISYEQCGFNHRKLENESVIMVDSGKNRSQFVIPTISHHVIFANAHEIPPLCFR